MSDWPILSLVIFLPIVGAAFIFLIRGESDLVARNARNVALWTTLITFALSLLLWINFDTSTASFQFTERQTWLSETITYHIGVDGISILLVVLTAILMPLGYGVGLIIRVPYYVAHDVWKAAGRPEEALVSGD